MNCVTCGGQLKISHSYRAGGTAKTQRGVCEACGRAFTIIAVVQEETTQGNGAYALAKRIEKNGTAPKVVVELGTEETQEEQND